tara:strand:- start:365 stop:1432 length:1068 start_codon:yes stop_codon:yes gene_type:complete
MKGLILAGGDGRRLRPLTHTNAKQLVPIANKPILHYVIDDLIEVGVNDLGIVVGETAEEIVSSVGDGSAWGAKITYIEQDKPLGLAHAVLVSNSFLKGDPFVMYLGDNMFEDSLDSVIAEFDPNLASARLLLARVEDPSAFGVAQLDINGRVVELTEKPEAPLSDLALVGVYLFGSRIHDAVRNIKPSNRGELEITDAIQWLIDAEEIVEHRVLDGWWIDTGKKDPLLKCNELVLDRIVTLIDGEVDKESVIEGPVIVEASSVVENSIIKGPVVVGPGARITNSTVGPYVSVGSGCNIDHSFVDRTVLMDRSRILDVTRGVTGSVLGRETEVIGSRKGDLSISVLLGDNSIVDFS